MTPIRNRNSKIRENVQGYADKRRPKLLIFACLQERHQDQKFASRLAYQSFDTEKGELSKEEDHPYVKRLEPSIFFHLLSSKKVVEMRVRHHYLNHFEFEFLDQLENHLGVSSRVDDHRFL